MQVQHLRNAQHQQSVALELIAVRHKYFTERKKTEYKNRFNEAYDFFEKRGCLEGVKK